MRGVSEEFARGERERGLVGLEFGEVSPGDKDEALIFEKFLEFGALDQVEIVLTPFGAPVGMIESGALDFRVVVGEVDDQLIGAGRKRLEHFLVGVKPLRLGDAGHNFQESIEDDGIRREAELREIRVVGVIFAGEEHGEFVGLAGGEINPGKVAGADDRAHVGVQMRDVDAGGNGFIHLSVSFRGHIGHLGVGDNVFAGQREVAIGIKEAGTWGLRRNWRPTVTGPISVERKVHAQVGVGMSLGPLRDFGEPGARNKDAGGSDPVFFERLENGRVYGVHHTEIVGVNDEETRTGGVAEALGERFCGGRSGLLSESGGELKEKKEKAEEEEQSRGRFHGFLKGESERRRNIGRNWRGSKEVAVQASAGRWVRCGSTPEKRRVVDCQDMGNSFDISLERLAGFGLGGGSTPASESGRFKGFGETQDPPSQNEDGAPTENPREKPQGSRTRSELHGYAGEKALEGTFFLETFGCQMNDHDSEKVAGVLLARGYKQVESPDTAAVILYNTCSIREKAAQKIFSRLGEYRFTKREGQVIGVLGCLAQQEGEEIFERAPWVSLVCGSASYRKLPELIAQLGRGISASRGSTRTRTRRLRQR